MKSAHPQTEKKKQAHPRRWGLGLLIGLVILLAVLSLLTGAYNLTARPEGWQMLWITRVPRTAALMLSGSAMALSGLVMQQISQNRFVEPTTTGTIEWAGLGLILCYIFVPSPSLFLRMTFAIVAAMIGTSLFFVMVRQIHLKSSLTLPLIGMMLGAVISAVTTLLALTFNLSHTLEIWFTASFASIEQGRYEYLWLILVMVVAIYYLADRLTIVGLGQEVATNLGVNYQRVTVISTLLVSFAVGIVASVAGYLPFIGLIVPNTISLLLGDHIRSNLPWVTLSGMAVMLSCDLLSRTLIAPFELPVSVILGTVGSATLIGLLLYQRRRWV